MDLQPGDVQTRQGTLVVVTREIDAEDITDLTYWTRRLQASRVRLRKGRGELTHLFELVVDGESVTFDVPVQPNPPGTAKRQALMAASVVDWLQKNVEARIRQRLVEEILAGQVRVGGMALNREGFGESSMVSSSKGPDFPWSRFLKAHVSLDSIDIMVNTDKTDQVAYAFSLKRSVLNTSVLPEVMAEVKDAAAP